MINQLLGYGYPVGETARIVEHGLRTGNGTRTESAFRELAMRKKVAAVPLPVPFTQAMIGTLFAFPVETGVNHDHNSQLNEPIEKCIARRYGRS